MGLTIREIVSQLPAQHEMLLPVGESSDFGWIGSALLQKHSRVLGERGLGDKQFLQCSHRLPFLAVDLALFLGSQQRVAPCLRKHKLEIALVRLICSLHTLPPVTPSIRGPSHRGIDS